MGLHNPESIQQAAHADFRPYNVLTISAVLPASLPNSELNTRHTFFIIGAQSYAFKMSAHYTPMSLSAAMTNTIMTVSSNYANICNSCWHFGHMTSCFKPSHTCEVLHFDVKHHMATHKLVAYGIPIW